MQKSIVHEKSRLVLLVSDRGFIIPTMLAAMQVAEQESVARVADIMIMLTDLTMQEAHDIQSCFEQYRISFQSVQGVSYQGQYFDNSASHVTAATMGRLHSPAIIPSRYSHILYLDGDIQVVGDIEPLVLHNVAAGFVLASSEHYFLGGPKVGRTAARWQDSLSYMRSLGISEPGDYFNAGVLASTRETWNEVCGAALDFFAKHPNLCRFHDQSALNAVCLGKREILSPKFNFGTFLAEIGGVDLVKPSIIHFTGASKPWLVPGDAIWKHPVSQKYVDFLEKFPCLIPYAADWSARRARLIQQPRPRRTLRSKFQEALVAHSRFRHLRRYMQRGEFAF